MTHFLLPVMALVLWTFVIAGVMYRRRIPAMQAVSGDAQDFIRRPDLIQTLPAEARWAADNYNHLHEQPTIFYAVMLVAHLSGQASTLDLALGWGYVALRVVHSLVQVTSNRVIVRFSVFAAGSIVLGALAVKTTLHLLV